MTKEPLATKPKTVDDFRTALWEHCRILDMGEVDDFLEYICDNSEMLAKWKAEYLL